MTPDPLRTRPAAAYAAGGALLALFGWYAFVRGARVPLLGWIDLAIHEAGHVLFLWLPGVGPAVMGSGLQIAMPLVLAGAFLLRERDLLGGVLTVGWAATSMQDASVYMADAPYERLPLIGGYHDWAFVFRELGVLEHSATIARAVWLLGLLAWLAAIVACSLGPRLERRLRGLPGGGTADAVAARAVEGARAVVRSDAVSGSRGQPLASPPADAAPAADPGGYFVRVAPPAGEDAPGPHSGPLDIPRPGAR